MASLDILIAVGTEDRDRIDTIASTVGLLLGDRSGRVIVGHVLTETEYETAVERLSPPVEQPGGPMSASRPETGAIHAGTSGESATGAEAGDRDTPSEAAAVERVVGQQTVVRDMIDALEEIGVTPEVRGAIGDPAARIEEMIDQQPLDFVLVGGRDRSPTRKAVFGSVSQEIIRFADCPVVSVRESGSD